MRNWAEALNVRHDHRKDMILDWGIEKCVEVTIRYSPVMQTLDVDHPELPDLQFVLMVAALCTADIPSLNVPEDVRRMVFDRCWALLHDIPPPTEPSQRVLDLREGDDVTLEALVEVIRSTLHEHGYSRMTWDQGPSEPSQSTSPDAQPLIDRLQYWDPAHPPPVDGPPETSHN